MNARPYPRTLVETCGLCLGCARAGVCPELDRDIARAVFPARLRAAMRDEVPELDELHRVYGAGAPPAARATPRAEG